jgi:peptidoglycan-associated lipoprotein
MNNRAFLVLAMTLLLAACSGNKGVKSGSTTDASANTTASGGAGQGGAAGDGAVASGMGAAGDSSSSAGSGDAVAAAGQVIYFDFDSSEIRAEYTAVLADRARALTRNASVRLRLEGHTDERGSREYNIGLGERRAQAVRRALLLQGVGEAQVPTVSYGEERAAVAGSSEDAYAKNRRVELIGAN